MRTKIIVTVFLHNTQFVGIKIRTIAGKHSAKADIGLHVHRKLVFFYGGDEFVVFLHQTNIEQIITTFAKGGGRVIECRNGERKEEKQL